MKALCESLYALADMVNQFAYTTKFYGKDALCDGGLSALERAFWVFKDKSKYVEQKHGQWNIVERNTIGRTVVVECGQCNAMFELLMFDFGMNYNHCPNCGAKMDGD